MSFLRAIFCILLPPLAVIDKGCGSFILVLALTILGWIPGMIGALLICLLYPTSDERFVIIDQNNPSDEVIDVKARHVGEDEK